MGKVADTTGISKRITVEYFAIFRECRGLSAEQLHTTARTARDLYCELAEQYNFPNAMDHIRVAVNHEFTGWDDAIDTDDTIVFIPPVAGG